MAELDIKPNWQAPITLGLVAREVVGWLLCLLGLNVFRISFGYLEERQVVEAFVASLIGLFIFRGGMQLVKVAVAARSLSHHESPEG